MTYEDILFLIGFFLVIAFFVGCKHKPATLSGWLAFAFLSFIVTPLISVPLTWYVCRMLDRATIKDKGYLILRILHLRDKIRSSYIISL